MKTKKMPSAQLIWIASTKPLGSLGSSSNKRRLLGCLAAITLMCLATVPAAAQCIRCGPFTVVIPHSLTFPSQAVGTRSTAKNITVTNMIPGFLHLSIVSTGLPYQSNGCTGILGPHKSCTISVTFAPTATGTVNGAITVNDGSALGHQRVTLSGTGVVAGASIPAAPNFGHTPLDTSRAVPLGTEVGNSKHSHYRVVDLGTLGGPNSYVSFTPIPMNNAGMIVGAGETTTLDPFAPYCFVADCSVAHTFRWRNGVLTDLGGLTSGASGNPNGINAAGVVAGISENGHFDPQSQFPPEFDAVVWKHGQVIDLGTFGGTFSYANAINDRNQVVGFALNGLSDSFFMDECGAGPMPSQMRAFIWQEGVGLQDLGTLGGPDSCALWINQRGEVAGHSFTSFTPDPGTGVPAFDPFVWRNGKMTDLGSLGGTQGHASAINNHGQVAGDSNLAGDQVQHAFFWHQGKMQDLTPGRGFSFAHGLNDNGEVVGGTSADGVSLNGFVWRQGVLTDLESVPGDRCDSFASSINSKSQIVGASFPCAGQKRAAIWDNGGPAIDLNTLVRPDSDLQLAEAQFINDRGEITGTAVLPNGDEHAFLLIPVDKDDAGSVTTAATAQPDLLPMTPSSSDLAHGTETHEKVAAFAERLAHRSRRMRAMPIK
jgi:probable HAF family extracellular repeat protein